MEQGERFLVIDDDPQVLELVRYRLGQESPNCQLRGVSDPDRYAEALAQGDFDLVITDYELPWTDGLTILRELKGHWPRRPVIMFTGSGSEEVAVEAMKAGLDDYVLKSAAHIVRLCVAVRTALERARERGRREEAEQRYRKLFEEVPVGLYLVSTDGALLHANAVLVKMLAAPSRGALLGANLAERFLHAEDRIRWLPSEGEAVRETSFPMRTFQGTTLWVESRVAQRERSRADPQQFYQGSLIDITARRRAEEQIRELEAPFLRAQRLESIGTLAGGIAHDFNNLLTPILMSVKLLRRNRPEAERRNLLDTLQASAERGAGMVKQLLSFAGGMGGQMVPLEPVRIIEEVQAILEHTLPRSITLRVLGQCPGLLSEIRASLAWKDSKALERAAHKLIGSVGDVGAAHAAEAALRLEEMARSANLAGAEALAILEHETRCLQEELTRFAGQPAS